MADTTGGRPPSPGGLRWTDPRAPFSWRGWSVGPETLRFGGNESPYPLPQELLDSISAAADRMNRYPFGMETALMEALAARMGCTPEQVIIAPGTNALIEALIKALGGPDHQVVFPDPSYPAFGGAASAVRAAVQRVPLRADGSCDVDAIAQACSDRTSLAIVCNPNNPTGGMVPTTTLDGVVETLPAQTLLMVDEAYWEFTDEYARGGRGALEYLDCGKPILVARTFSKFYGLAGLRVGYGIASADIAAELRARLRLGGSNVAALVAAEAALGLVDLFAERTETIKAERRRLWHAFADFGFDPLPTQANFVFCKHVGDLPAKLLAAGYWVRDGASVLIPDGMRVTVSTPEDNDKLLGTIQALLPD